MKRLDRLTQEEARMATAETLKITRGVDSNVKVLIDGAQSNFLVIHAVLMVYINRRKRRETFVFQSCCSSILEPHYGHRKADATRPPLLALTPDSSTNHNISRNAHHEGTATWFFQGGIYTEWRSTSSLLWIHGKRTFPPLPAS